MTWSCDWLAAESADEAPAQAWEPTHLAVETAPAATLAVATEPGEAALLRELHEAYERGRSDGQRDAQDRNAARLHSALAVLDAVTGELQALQDPWAREAHEHLLALALAVAQHVIEREVRTDASIIADLVRQALTQFPLTEPVRIRVHPEDLSTLSLSRPDGELRLAPGRQVEWIADATISTGGCVVEGPRRVVDGRVRQVLERTFEALRHG